MDRLFIKGGKILNGSVITSGSKNAALPILFSTLLTDGKHVFKNVPRLKDIESTIDLLSSLGSQCHWEDSYLIVETKKTKTLKADYDLVRKMRASILCLGPLLARYGEAQVSLPGGCAIGARPINFHLEALKTMGAEIKIEEGYVHVRAQKLVGGTVLFEMPTVGGTENIMMAAVLSEGKTIIENAAKEPEIVDLALYLKKMGAKIKGEGTSIIEIEGTKDQLRPAEHCVLPDRIEAGTLVLAAAITGGEVCVDQCVPDHIDSLLIKLKDCGVIVSTENSRVIVHKNKYIQSVDISTAPFPAFPTDLQAQFMALMVQASGTSIITESIFENRFMHAQELLRMNADISIASRVCVVRGRSGGLIGAPVMATDLRASACLVLAGLVAKGVTTVNRIYHLDRGYEKLEEKLSLLGADVRRLSSSTETSL